MSLNVELKSVARHYGRVKAVDGVSFSAAPGEVIALVGHNGAGKTTTLNAMLGLTTCQGSIRVLGLDPFAHRARLMRDVAFVSDVASLPRFLTVRDLLGV